MYLAMVFVSVTAGELYEYDCSSVGHRLCIVPGVSQVIVYGS